MEFGETTIYSLETEVRIDAVGQALELDLSLFEIGNHKISPDVEAAFMSTCTQLSQSDFGQGRAHRLS